jgi:PadR family transcriptional regulator PadR
MDTQLKKGLLEMCVLKYLARQPSYGYEIITGVSEFVPMPESTLYTILKRSENQGYLMTRRKECEGRLRKYYKLTRSGRKKLNAFKGEYAKMQQLLTYILGGNDEK